MHEAIYEAETLKWVVEHDQINNTVWDHNHIQIQNVQTILSEVHIALLTNYSMQDVQ